MTVEIDVKAYFNLKRVLVTIKRQLMLPTVYLIHNMCESNVKNKTLKYIYSR